MKVSWAVNCGSVGKPIHTIEVDDNELEDCETEGDRERMICQCIQEDFQKKVTWYEFDRY